MSRIPAVFCLLTLVCTSVVAQDKVKRDPLDWTYWRGPEQNGISRETGLPDTWNPAGGEGSNLAWKREDIGGRSTPVVMNGKLYTIVGERNPKDRDLFLQEKVVCLNTETGKTIWEVKNNVWNSDVPDVRVGWSSVVADPETGYVYAQGANGLFQCLEGASGKVVWKIPMSERFGLLTTYGGRTNFPVIFEDMVIISGVVIGWGEQARPNHRVLGMDKKSGEVRWYVGTRNAPEDTTYSSPIIATFKGQKAIVLGCGDGAVWCFQPRTGKTIWQYDFSQRGLNTTPLVVGDKVYMGHSEENVGAATMGALAAIDATKAGDITKTGEIWKVEELGIGRSAPVLIGDKLYAMDDAAKLYVVDVKTGEKIGPPRGVGLGTISRPSVTWADGKLWLLEANGRWAILPIKEDGTVDRPKPRVNSGKLDAEFHASPVISHGKVYLLSTECLYCLEDKEKKHGADPIPESKEVESELADMKPAHVQVIPCELLMKPGEKQKFTVKLFNAKGQLLKTADADFSIETKGGAEGAKADEISKAGELTAAEGKQHAVYVTAKVGELTGTARVRVVPELPWSFDFEDKADLPITWIGMRYRHVLRKVGDGMVAVKITTIPKGTRSRGWLGHSDLSNYTIQADVMSDKSAQGKMADIGLSAQGYTLDMQGDQQKLQLRLWDAQLERFSKTIPFAWKDKTWYTMKLEASIVDDKAVLKAKVWPRDDKEPTAWNIEATDDLPVYEAAPGMFGNATNAEITLDNIKVYENKGK